MSTLVEIELLPRHKVLLKKAYLVIQKDCNHYVGGAKAGTMCDCATLLTMSEAE